MSSTEHGLPFGFLARNESSDAFDELAQSSLSIDSRLDALCDSMVVLRRSPTVEAALVAAPEQLSRSGRFARVLLSRIEGSLWIPQYWYARTLEAEAEQTIENRLRTLRVPLCSTMIETEVVRRRCSQLVSSTQTDTRVHRPFIDATRTHSYVVAPIVMGDEAIALLHADHGAQRHPVSETDHDIVRHFADMLGPVVESIALTERITHERDQIRTALATVDSVLSADDTPSLPVIETRAVSVEPHVREAHPWHLSDREAAVLELLADGLTNREIAERLFVTESTVKSHIKHIFRKQGVTTRSEAIARVWSRVRWQELRAS